MKKIIFAALMSSLFAIGAMAQSRPDIIVSAGYQGANMTGLEKSKMASGARVGVALDFAVADMGTMQFSVQPGVYYSMKGHKYESSVDAGKLISNTTSITTHTHYIDIPVLANLRFAAGNNLSAFVNAGPYIGVGLAGTRTAKTSGTSLVGGDYSKTDSKSIKVFDKDGNGNALYNRFDWGFQVGAGVEYSRILLGVGYQIGLYDVTAVSKDNKNYNNNFFVTLGYRF